MLAMTDVSSLPTRLAVPAAYRHAQCLLLPIKRPGDCRQAIAYAVSRCTDEHRVAVALLHIEDSENDSRIPARYRTGTLFARATRMLEHRDIEFAAYVRSGPVVFSILDAAEELDCSEIVVPAPAWPLARLWSQRVVAALLAGQRSIPVVTVNKRGIRSAAVAAPKPAA